MSRGLVQNIRDGELPSARGTYTDFIELPKIQRAVAVDGGPDVLAVVAALHHLQLPHAAHVGEPCLDLCHVWHLPTRTDTSMINSEISELLLYAPSYLSDLVRKHAEAC